MINTPDFVVRAVESSHFAQSLPPLSPDLSTLLQLQADERDNPRIIALLSQRDPIYTARLMSFANSSVFAHHGVTSSIDVAVRRLGVTQSYNILLACALAYSFPNLAGLDNCRVVLLKYTISLTLTAKKMGEWLNLSEAHKTVLWLSALMYCTGIFGGLVYSTTNFEPFKAGLLGCMNANSYDLTSEPRLNGFLVLSVNIAKIWGMDERVGLALLDANKGVRVTSEGKLLTALTQVINLATSNKNQLEAFAGLAESGIISFDVPVESKISIAVIF